LKEDKPSNNVNPSLIIMVLLVLYENSLQWTNDSLAIKIHVFKMYMGNLKCNTFFFLNSLSMDDDSFQS
jgi:hypothetical protein